MKIKLLLVLALFILIQSAQLYSQTTICDTFFITSEKGKDAYVNSHSSYVNTNFGNTEEFEAQAWTAGGDEFLVRSFIDFEFYLIPQNSTIISASLTLFHKPGEPHSTLSGSNACYLERITSPWQESTVVWNNQPTTTTVNHAIIPMSTVGTQDYHNIDITNLVTDIHNNLTNSYGIAIKLQTEIHYRQMYFSSGDSQDPSKRPYLIVCYEIINGISDSNSKGDRVIIYPNPSNGYITTNISDIEYVEIYNIKGELIKTCTDKNIDLSNQAKGIYLVKLISDKEVLIEKLIIE